MTSTHPRRLDSKDPLIALGFGRSQNGGNHFDPGSSGAGKDSGFRGGLPSSDQRFSIFRDSDPATSAGSPAPQPTSRPSDLLSTSTASVTVTDTLILTLSPSALSSRSASSTASMSATFSSTSLHLPTISSTPARPAITMLTSALSPSSSVPNTQDAGSPSVAKHTIAAVLAAVTTVILVGICLLVAWKRRRRRPQKQQALDPFVDVEAARVGTESETMRGARVTRKAAIGSSSVEQSVLASTVTGSVAAATIGSQSLPDSSSLSHTTHSASLHQETDGSGQLERTTVHMFRQHSVTVTESEPSTLPPPYEGAHTELSRRDKGMSQ